MNRLPVNMGRFLLAGLGCFTVLRFSYREINGADEAVSYAVVCTILSLCGLASWLFRWRRSQIAQCATSAVIAFALSLGLIWLSQAMYFVDGLPWQFFYKDDYIVVFQLIAPITIAVLSGLLTLIPEKARAPRGAIPE